jgi:hypothetical protein
MIDQNLIHNLINANTDAQVIMMLCINPIVFRRCHHQRVVRHPHKGYQVVLERGLVARAGK